MARSLRRWFWVVGVAAVLALVIRHFATSEEWRAFRWSELWRSLRNTHPGYILAAVVATMSTYLWRALRWSYFLAGVGKVPLRIHFSGQVIGFSCIYLVGRAGELARPAYVAHKGEVPWASMAAVWFLERVYDAVFLLLILAASLYFFPPAHEGVESSRVLQGLTQSGKILIWVAGALVAGLVIFRLYVERILSYLSHPSRYFSLSGRSGGRVKSWIRSFASGLEVVENWRAFAGSMVCSVLVWIANLSVFWLVAQGVGGEAARIPWLALGVPMFCGVIGLAVQVPGVGGGYQVAAALGFTEVLGIDAVPASSVALLTWLVIMAPATLLGIVLMVREGLSVGKLRLWAAEGKASPGGGP